MLGQLPLPGRSPFGVPVGWRRQRGQFVAGRVGVFSCRRGIAVTVGVVFIAHRDLS